MGFRSHHLKTVQDAINHKQKGQTFSHSNPRITAELYRCWYDKAVQKKLIKDAFEKAVSHCEKLGDRAQHADFSALRDAILRPISREYKDPTFEDEREWRLVIEFWRPRFGAVRFGDSREPEQEEEPQKDQKNEMLSGSELANSHSFHTSVPLAVNGSFGLAEVVVGPTPLSELARSAATRYLRDRAASVKVCLSDIPFRRV